MKMKSILRMTGIILISFVLLTSVVVWALSPKENIEHSKVHVGKTYSTAMNDKKPSIVLFYADWCTYCMKFMPKYKLLANIYKDKYNFIMINADNPTYDGLRKNYAIGGYPTIYIVDPSIDNRILISNTIYDDLERLRGEFDRYLRIRAMIK